MYLHVHVSEQLSIFFYKFILLLCFKNCLSLFNNSYKTKELHDHAQSKNHTIFSNTCTIPHVTGTNQQRHTNYMYLTRSACKQSRWKIYTCTTVTHKYNFKNYNIKMIVCNALNNQYCCAICTCAMCFVLVFLFKNA